MTMSAVPRRCAPGSCYRHGRSMEEQTGGCVVGAGSSRRRRVMPSTRRCGVDNTLPSLSLPVAGSNAATSVKVPPMSAARRKLGRPAGIAIDLKISFEGRELDPGPTRPVAPTTNVATRASSRRRAGILLDRPVFSSRHPDPSRRGGIVGHAAGGTITPQHATPSP